MKPSMVFTTVILSIALSGCAMMGGGPRSSDCKTASGKCEVMISVTEPCNTSGNIVVTPDTLELAGKNHVKITWEFAGGSYDFCPGNGDGVVFKSGDLDFQFYDPGYEGGGANCKKKYKWMDKNDNWTWGKDYRYSIQFTGPNGRCYVDPFIRNG